ncbi:MAG: hypothetical protein QXM46_01030 [Candidatus Hadarchaeales archaeon]
MERGVVTVVAATVLVLLVTMALVIFLPPFFESQVKSREKAQMEEVRETLSTLQASLYRMTQGESLSFVLPMSPDSFFLSPTGKTACLSLGVEWGNENDLGRLRYSMTTRSYPSYILGLEGGGVVLEQEGVSLMTFPPLLVRAVDLGENKVRVDVEWVHLVGENVRLSKRSPATLTLTCVEERYTSWAEENCNAENVVVDLTGRVEYENAWQRYLVELRDGLNSMGLNASLSGLKLTILGRVTAAGTKDLYYFEHLRKVAVWLA